MQKKKNTQKNIYRYILRRLHLHEMYDYICMYVCTDISYLPLLFLLVLLFLLFPNVKYGYFIFPNSMISTGARMHEGGAIILVEQKYVGGKQDSKKQAHHAKNEGGGGGGLRISSPPPPPASAVTGYIYYSCLMALCRWGRGRMIRVS